MAKQGAKVAVPRLRFPEFRHHVGFGPAAIGRAFGQITNGKANAQDHEEGGAFPLFDRSEVIKASSKFAFDSEAVILPGEGMSFRPRYFEGKFDLHQRAYALMECQGHSKYFYYALDHAKAELALKAVKSTVLSLRLPIIEKFVVFAPSDNAEQQKIADCLTSLDEVIAAQGRKVEALKAHKRGLMQQLFPRAGETRPRLRFPEFRNAPEWEQHRLGDIASISKGKGISKADIAVEGRTPCIRYGELYTVYGEVIDRPLSRTDVPAAELVLSQAGDVLVPASGETKEDIATSAVVLGAGVALGSDLNIIRLDADGRFFSYYLNGAKRRALAKVAQGDTVVHLYPRQLEQLDVAIPVDKAEQQRIADCLSSLDTQITAETNQLAALKTHKQGLMQQLFPAPEAATA